MAKQNVYKLFRGGDSTSIHNFRCDGTNIYSDKMPTEVAAEYAGGRYTFSFPLAPSAMTWQRNAFRNCGANGQVAAGDFLAMLRIPSKHRIEGVSLELKVQHPAMDGWKLALQGYVYRDGEQVEIIDESTPIALCEKDGEKVFVFTEEFDRVLLENETMIIGLNVVAAKDSEEYPLSEFEGQVAVTAVVQRLFSGVAVL